VPAPLKVLGDAHPAMVTLVQAPVVLLQQAPRRAVQGLGVQVVAPSVKVLVPVQPLTERMVHVPPVVQHEPTFGHGLGSQTVPAPPKVLGEAHPARVALVQAPVVLLQQAPRRAVQGFVGAHAAPAPWKLLVPVHAEASTTVHVPELEQQAPARVGAQVEAVVQAAPLVTVRTKGEGTVVVPKVLTRM
jgi:hypothetical protein